MDKKTVVDYGKRIAGIIEAICIPHMDGEALKFTQLHWRCQDYYDHPDWPEYERLVMKAKTFLEE